MVLEVETAPNSQRMLDYAPTQENTDAFGYNGVKMTATIQGRVIKQQTPVLPTAHMLPSLLRQFSVTNGPGSPVHRQLPGFRDSVHSEHRCLYSDFHSVLYAEICCHIPSSKVQPLQWLVRNASYCSPCFGHQPWHQKTKPATCPLHQPSYQPNLQLNSKSSANSSGTAAGARRTSRPTETNLTRVFCWQPPATPQSTHWATHPSPVSPGYYLPTSPSSASDHTSWRWHTVLPEEIKPTTHSARYESATHREQSSKYKRCSGQMLTENRGICESLAHPSSETAFCCPYMDRSSAIIYIYTYIYIYIYMDINNHSYHSSNVVLWFHPQYPMLLCFLFLVDVVVLQLFRA